MSQPWSAVNMVIANEGGLSTDELDPGGITNMGISLRFLKSLDPERLKKYGVSEPVNEETIRELNLPTVQAIYICEFWDFFRFKELNDQLLANYVFDCAINPNPANAFRFLQRAIWTYAGYEKCKDDGIMGSKTIALANAYGRCLIRSMMSERAAWYRAHANERYIDGWLRRAYREPFE